MTEHKYIPIELNKKPVEEVRYIEDYQVPSWEEFEKNWQADEKVVESYNNENESFDDIRISKMCGPMYRFNRALSLAHMRGEVSGEAATRLARLVLDADSDDDLQREINRIVSEIRNDTNVSLNINIYNIIVRIVREENITIIRVPSIESFPNINSVTFNTTGSTKPDNYRGVGTAVGGLVGNIIGGFIKDEDRNKPQGVLFASNKRHPLSFWSFYETGNSFTPFGSSRGDFHDDKIICKSEDHLNELKSKIGNIVEVWEWKFANINNRVDKEREFKNKVESLLDRYYEGGNINGHYTI